MGDRACQGTGSIFSGKAPEKNLHPKPLTGGGCTGLQGKGIGIRADAKNCSMDKNNSDNNDFVPADQEEEERSCMTIVAAAL